MIKLSGPEIVLRREELNRVIKAMQDISHSYAEHQHWTKRDLARFAMLRERKKYLKILLDVVV